MSASCGSCETSSSGPSRNAAATCSRCWARPASASHGWCTSSCERRPATARSCAGGVCPMARASRSSRSWRCWCSWASRRRECWHGSSAAERLLPASSSSRCAGCSSNAPRIARWSSSSMTCTGPSRRCSTCSTTSPTCHARRRSCCSASLGRSCSRSAEPGPAASSTPPPRCSSRFRSPPPSSSSGGSPRNSTTSHAHAWWKPARATRCSSRRWSRSRARAASSKCRRPSRRSWPRGSSGWPSTSAA